MYYRSNEIAPAISVCEAIFVSSLSRREKKFLTRPMNAEHAAQRAIDDDDCLITISSGEGIPHLKRGIQK